MCVPGKSNGRSPVIADPDVLETLYIIKSKKSRWAPIGIAQQVSVIVGFNITVQVIEVKLKLFTAVQTHYGITVDITSLGKSNRMNIGFVNVIRDLCRRHNKRKTKEREEKMLHMDEREIKI